MSGLIPWSMDRDYERFTGTPFVERLYDWTLRRYVQVRGIKLGRPDGVTARTGEELLQPERLEYEDARQPLAPRIVGVLRERGPMTAIEIARALGLESHSGVQNWLSKNLYAVEEVGRKEMPVGTGRWVKVWRAVDGYVYVPHKPAGQPNTIIGAIRRGLEVHGPMSGTTIQSKIGGDKNHIVRVMRNYSNQFFVYGSEPVPGQKGSTRLVWGLVGVHDQQEAGNG